MIESLDSGELDLIGIGRPMIAEPGGPKRLLSGAIDCLPSFERTLDIFHLMPWNTVQIERLGVGFDPDLSLTGEAAVAAFAELEGRKMAALIDSRGRSHSPDTVSKN
jgi:hypothetical protein